MIYYFMIEKKVLSDLDLLSLLHCVAVSWRSDEAEQKNSISRRLGPISIVKVGTI